MRTFLRLLIYSVIQLKLIYYLFKYLYLFLKINKSSGARIEVPKDGSNKVTITGSAEAVAQAKAEIKKIVDEQSARKVPSALPPFLGRCHVSSPSPVLPPHSRRPPSSPRKKPKSSPSATV